MAERKKLTVVIKELKEIRERTSCAKKKQELTKKIDSLYSFLPIKYN